MHGELPETILVLRWALFLFLTGLRMLIADWPGAETLDTCLNISEAPDIFSSKAVGLCFLIALCPF